MSLVGIRDHFSLPLLVVLAKMEGLPLLYKLRVSACP